MAIDLHNYEEWLISYIDGELDRSQVTELMDFIEANPRLKDELRIFKSMKLTPDPAVNYGVKSSLYRYVQPKRVIYTRAWFLAAAAGVLLLLAALFYRQPVGNNPKTIASRNVTMIRKVNPGVNRQHRPSSASNTNLATANHKVLPSTGNPPPGFLPYRKHPLPVPAPGSAGAGRLASAGPAGSQASLPEPALQPLPAFRVRPAVDTLALAGPPISPPDLIEREPKIVPVSVASTRRVLATIPGRGTRRLLKVAVMLKQFLSRNNPVQAKNDLVRVARYEMLKLNGNQ